MGIKIKQIELKLLFLVALAIFFVALSTASADPRTDIPTIEKKGIGKVKELIDDHIHAPAILQELYSTGRIISVTQQGVVTRAEVQNGRVPVIRYNHAKIGGRRFAPTCYAISELKKYFKLNGEKPTIPDGDYEGADLRVIRRLRRSTGYTMSERRRALTELGDTAENRAKYVCRSNPHVDELEAIIVANAKPEQPFFKKDRNGKVIETRSYAGIPYGGIYKFHDIFLDQNDYNNLMPQDFPLSHMLTAADLETVATEATKHIDPARRARMKKSVLSLNLSKADVRSHIYPENS